MHDAMHFIASMYSAVGAVTRSPGNCGRSPVTASCLVERNPLAQSFSQALGKILLVLDQDGGLAHHRGGLEDGIDIFGAGAYLERKHHHGAAEEADLTLDSAVGKVLRHPRKRSGYLLTLEYALRF